MKPFASKFYRSTAWKKCRESYITSVHGLCEKCLERGLYTPGKIVHHTVYLTPENIDDPAISLNHELLEYHCQDCHNREHHRTKEVVAKGLMFDENGDLIKA